MNQIEIEALAKAIAKEWSWAPWLIVIVSGLCAAAGTYLYSFFKKTGEIDATTIKIDVLNEQLRITTEIASDVKRRIDDKGWLSQQNWARRESHYLKMLSSLMRYEQACRVLGDHLRSKNNPYVSNKDYIDEYRVSGFLIYESYGVAELFVKNDELATLNEFFLKIYESASNANGVSWVMLDVQVKAVQKARKIILGCAKRDLASLEAVG